MAAWFGILLGSWASAARRPELALSTVSWREVGGFPGHREKQPSVSSCSCDDDEDDDDDDVDDDDDCQ